MENLFIYLLLGVFTLTKVAAVKIASQCALSIDSDYPVCATNGTHWFLFKNDYRLTMENMKREKTSSKILEKTDIANCFQRCDQVCTDEYAPICTTSDGERKTFQNRCQLDLENCRTKRNWKILHEGKCSPVNELTETNTQPPTTEPPKSPTLSPDYDCPKFCTMEYQPICASFGDIDETFHNLCYLKSDICTSGRDWTIKYNGECDAPVPECNEACPKIYSPLCATFDGENKTFANECLLDLEICKTKNKWNVLYKGECQEPDTVCPTICPEIYEPVCAKYNGQLKTFPNKCFLAAEACKTKQEWLIEYSGECRSPSVKCPEFCPFIYQPVCSIFNGETKTFPNKCSLDVEICKSGNKWEILYNGECEPPKPLIPPLEPIVPYYPPAPEIPLPSPPPPSNCPDVCPALYKPVCAIFNGSKRTFSNTCELGATVCKTGQDWKVLFDGACDNAIQINAENPEITVCPAIYDPICASFHGVTKTFSNKCQLDAEIAQTGQAWDILGPGECQVPPPDGPKGPCPKCTNFYNPVCGFYNGEQKTFTNECQLFGANCNSDTKWIKLYDGECKPKNGPNICPLYYDPVCATHDGIKKTFPNECELNQEAHKTNTEWTILNKGECDNCPVCSDNIDPVCAKFNDQVKTFNNTCKMEYENCKTGSDWKIVSKSACQTDNCPQFCPAVYSPVCGVNNANNEQKTFGNTCEMNREACNTQTTWTIVSEGECPPENSDCPKTCPSLYNPVCAIFQGVSKTFDNECLMRVEVCETKKNWLFVHQGPCSDQLLPPPPPVPVELPPSKPVPEPVTNKKLIAFRIDRIKQYNVERPHSIPRPHKPCQIVECLDVYEPVCATYKGENVEFTNLCYMENTKCAAGEDWQIINYGPCQKPA